MKTNFEQKHIEQQPTRKKHQHRRLKKQVCFIPLILLALICTALYFFPLTEDSQSMANTVSEAQDTGLTIQKLDEQVKNIWANAITVIQKVSKSGDLIPDEFYVVKTSDMDEEALKSEAAAKEKNAMRQYVTALARGEESVPFKKNGSIFSNKAAGKKVALTFDDGPYKNMTAEYLKVLDQYNVHATFFVLGQYVLQRPEITQNIAASGNEVASHSWYHHNLPKMKKADIQEDFRKTEAAFYQVLGYPPNLFRAPYGALNADVKAVAKEYSQQSVLWSIDPLDWKSKDSDKLAAYILNRVSDGDIILLHENKKSTLAALPKIIEGLQKKGFEICTVSELIYSTQRVDAEQ